MPFRPAAIAVVSTTGLCALALTAAAPMAQAVTAGGGTHPTLWVSSATVAGGNGTSCAAPGFSTVQAAVTAAPAGATVKVCGGTYIEQVEITKSLTLTGTNGKVTLALPASPQDSTACAATSSSQYGVDVCGPISVTLSHLVIHSAWPLNTCNDDINAVFVAGGATLDFTDSAVTAAGAVPLNGCQGGIGVKVTDGHLKMQDDAISGYQKDGIRVQNAGSTAAVSNVEVTGAGPTPDIAQNGIEILYGASGSITGSKVSGNECDHPSCGPDSVNQSQGAGFLLLDAAPGVAVSHSTASGNDMGLYFAASSTASTGAWIRHDNLVHNRFEDVSLDQGRAQITYSVIRGGKIALQAVQYNAQTAGIDAAASHDTIGPASVDAVQIYSDENATDFPGKLVVSYSSINGSIANNSPAGAPVKLFVHHIS
jgi:Right handed beta helix region